MRVSSAHPPGPVDAGPVTGTMWRARAACQDFDPTLWHPDRPADPRRVADAKAICAGCPVRRLCVSTAAAQRPGGGIWGALGAKALAECGGDVDAAVEASDRAAERALAELRRRRARAAAAPATGVALRRAA